MKYNLDNEEEAQEAATYLAALVAKHSLVEIKKISPHRSLNQNSYLHLLLDAFAVHFGLNREEAKQIYKEINKDLYIYKKKGHVFTRSSGDLSKEEMTLTVDKFRSKSAEQGCELPLAIDSDWLRNIENEAEKTKHYLN